MDHRGVTLESALLWNDKSGLRSVNPTYRYERLLFLIESLISEPI